MYSVADVFAINHQAVAVATYYLDQAVADPSVVQTPVQYQLASLTALHMALKLYGNKLFPLAELVKLGRGQFSTAHVAEMERNMTKSMKWHLTPPTAYCYLIEFEKLFSNTESSSWAKEGLRKRAQQLIQDAVLSSEGDYDFDTFPPSMIACAAMLLAMEQQGRGLLSLEDFEGFLSNLHMVAELNLDSIGLLEDAIRLLDPTVQSVVEDQEPREQEERDEQRLQEQQQQHQPQHPVPFKPTRKSMQSATTRKGGNVLTPSSSCANISKQFFSSPTSVQEQVPSPRHVTDQR
jgi:hypothetical protein